MVMLKSGLMPDSTGSILGIAMTCRALCLPLLAALSVGLAAPAMAQPGLPPIPAHATPMPAVDAAGDYYGNGAPDPRPYWQGGYDQARADWLNECRSNRGHGKTAGGAVVGGLVGGVIGNRVAGSGSRVEGTVLGAAAGAVVGGAIGNATDRRSARDYCADYLDHYTSRQGGYGYGRPGAYGYGQPGYGYQPMMVMVPVMMMPAPGGQRECTETVVTEEYVTEAPRRVLRRMIRPRIPVIPRAAPVASDKRVRAN